MAFGTLDVVVFIVFVVSVIGLGLYKSKSKEEKTGEDYFLAGRGLKWWLIGFSLIAANISSEQFVGMCGNAASHVGLAIASYEWMAAITLVVVAFCFLPYFLRAGIYTMPEFLEYRYNATARTIMAVATLFIYMLLLGSVTYSGALTVNTMGGKMGYDISIASASMVLGLIAMVYVAAGGLKACAWADLIQGSALILGGGAIVYFAFDKLGAVTEATKVINVATGEVALVPLAEGMGAIDRFWELNGVRMNMFLPADDKVLPWTALLLGLWIPNFYYWGLNQYITQRTLGSASLAEGQKGIVFAAFMKLLIPFVIVVPGIIAFNLYAKDMQHQSTFDNAPVFAKYLQANPSTNFVEQAAAPSEGAIRSWPQGGKFMLSVYETQEQMKAVETQNPFVLPILQETLDGLTVEPYTVFKSDDKAWKTVFGELAAELDAYNQSVVTAAAGATVTTEKFIAYKYDTALGQLLTGVLPAKSGWLGFVLAALLGAIVSSLAAMLNAASTIFTIDIYQKYIKPDAKPGTLVLLGRICVVVFAVIAVILAPMLGNPRISNSIFTIIQEGQGFISPGILAVFVFGLISRKAPPMAGVIGLLTNIVSYGALKMVAPNIQFLNRMAICFALCLIIMALIRKLWPLAQPIEFKAKTDINLEPSKGAKLVGVIIVLLTLALYAVFSPIGLAK